MWAVGTYFDAASGNQHTLVAPPRPRLAAGGRAQPGYRDAVLGAVSASGDEAWASDFAKTGVRDPLIEFHRD